MGAFLFPIAVIAHDVLKAALFKQDGFSHLGAVGFVRGGGFRAAAAAAQGKRCRQHGQHEHCKFFHEKFLPRTSFLFTLSV